MLCHAHSDFQILDFYRYMIVHFLKNKSTKIFRSAELSEIPLDIYEVRKVTTLYVEHIFGKIMSSNIINRELTQEVIKLLLSVA